MKKNWKKLKKNFIKGIIFFLTIINILPSIIYAQDLLEDSFRSAMGNDSIIEIGNDKDAVWKEFFEEGTDINIDAMRRCFVNGVEKSNVKTKSDCKETKWSRELGKICYINNAARYDISTETLCKEAEWKRKLIQMTKKAPLTVRITKFFLRMTVAISITMIIYNWVYYIIESAKWADVTKAKNNLIYVGVWLLTSLMSLTIINLISSISISSLDLDDEITQISFRDQFEWLCSLASNDREKTKDELNREKTTELQTFCSDLKQPINRTSQQMNWILTKIMEENRANRPIETLNATIDYYNNNPWDRNTTKLLQMEAYISDINQQSTISN